MFEDIFGPSTSGLREACKELNISMLTIATALLDKGLISGDDILAARPKAVHAVEQDLARADEEARKKLDERHPGLRELFGKIMGQEP